METPIRHPSDVNEVLSPQERKINHVRDEVDTIEDRVRLQLPRERKRLLRKMYRDLVHLRTPRGTLRHAAKNSWVWLSKESKMENHQVQKLKNILKSVGEFRYDSASMVEQLTTLLLELDSIESSGDTALKKHRKQQVRRIQDLLNEADSFSNKANELRERGMTLIQPMISALEGSCEAIQESSEDSLSEFECDGEHERQTKEISSDDSKHPKSTEEDMNVDTTLNMREVRKASPKSDIGDDDVTESTDEKVKQEGFDGESRSAVTDKEQIESRKYVECPPVPGKGDESGSTETVEPPEVASTSNQNVHLSSDNQTTVPGQCDERSCAELMKKTLDTEDPCDSAVQVKASKWIPEYHLSEGRNGFDLTVQMQHVDVDDVDVTISESGILSIKGIRQGPGLGDDGKEANYASKRGHFRLKKRFDPNEIDVNQATVKMGDDDVLDVHIPFIQKPDQKISMEHYEGAENCLTLPKNYFVNQFLPLRHEQRKRKHQSPPTRRKRRRHENIYVVAPTFWDSEYGPRFRCQRPQNYYIDEPVELTYLY
jgi:HSP20 family molecular chaperone IbpA